MRDRSKLCEVRDHLYMTEHSKRYRRANQICFVIMVLFFVCILIGLVYIEDTSHWARISSVKAADTIPISFSELERKNEGGDTLDLFSSNIDYKFKVTMDDGKEYTIGDMGMWGTSTDEYDGVFYIYATVSRSECLKSLAEGKNTVEVNVTVEMGKNGMLLFDYKAVDTYETTVVKWIEESIIEEVKPVTDEEFIFYDSAEIPDISSREFEITYSDGRKVTEKPEVKKDEYGLYEFYLDGNICGLYMNEDNDYDLLVRDCQTVLESTTYSLPIESIEITDCTFDSQYKPLSVSYVITKTNKEVITGTSEVDYYEEYTDCYRLADTVYGYCIYVRPEAVYESIFSDAKIELTAVVAKYHNRPVQYVGVFSAPESDCECICHSNKKIMRGYNRFIRKMEKLLSVDEKCECGEMHYEKKGEK